MLNCNTEFLDADERRDHEFSQALDALAEFAGIKEKTNSQNTNLEKTASIHFPDSEQPITINKSSKSVPTGFILKGVSYSVANWRDLYKKFVTALYHDGNYTDFIKESIKKQYFGFTDEAHKFKLQKEIKIAPDFYLEGILATDVIINRVRYGYFPATIKDVIFQNNGRTYQFEPVLNGMIYSVVPDSLTISAVDKALAGEDYSQGALYFCMQTSPNSWFNRSLTLLFVHGAHWFYR